MYVDGCINTNVWCLQLAYDFPEDAFGFERFPKHLERYIPNVYPQNSPPTLLGTMDMSFIMSTSVLIATRHLSDGDEVLMDYRLNNEETYPPWYVPVPVSPEVKSLE